jgi:uncharacterized PurR-regulated membrane protein YhhQ (DUF165 family)
MPIKHDHWVLPSRQHDYPTRETLEGVTLHARREATFLVLAAIFFVATAMLPLLGTQSIELARVLPDLELPIAMQLPFGVLAFPLGLVAASLVCQLYGRRRAIVLVTVGTLACFALAGFMRVAGDDQAFGAALALASCFAVAQVSNVLLFDGMRRRMAGRQLWLRSVVSIVLAQMGAWAAFAFVMYGYAMYSGTSESEAVTLVVAIAAGSCAYVVAFAVATLLPIVAVAKGLAVYLRVGRFVDDTRAVAAIAPAVSPPEAQGPLRLPSTPAPVHASAPLPSTHGGPRPEPVITVERPVPTRAERRAARSSIQGSPSQGSPIQPFNSAEMRFFTEGDALEAGDSGELAQARA